MTQDAWRQGTRADHDVAVAGVFAEVSTLARVGTAFKACVADLRLFLEALRGRLGADDERLARGNDEAGRWALLADVAPSAVAHLAACFRDLDAVLAPLDGAGRQAHHAYFQRHLGRLFTDETVFFRRAYLKPLGYAGDYEMMNLIYEERLSASSSFGRALDCFGYATTASCAVRNRIPHLSRRVIELLPQRPGARFASIACGPALEVRSMLARPAALAGCTVTLLDAEAEAIRHCERTIVEPFAGSRPDVDLRLLKTSVHELVGRRLGEKLEAQDVIISVGLFDYFDDRLFRRMLKVLYGMLRPGGHLLVGNFDTNDARTVIELAMEWYLHYRSAAALRALCADLPTDAFITVEAEPLGANLFLHITKPE
jgi:extracellular factor (EF) 3-hydroxypalmitic acid methyl ester biosynthesis protein